MTPDPDIGGGRTRKILTLDGGGVRGALTVEILSCRTFGRCLCGDPLDREIGHMLHAHDDPCGGPVDPKLFTYMRYNAELTSQGLGRLGVGDIDPVKVQKLDSVAGIPDLQRIGRAVATRQVENAHFDGFDA